MKKTDRSHTYDNWSFLERGRGKAAPSQRLHADSLRGSHKKPDEGNRFSQRYQKTVKYFMTPGGTHFLLDDKIN